MLSEKFGTSAVPCTSMRFNRPPNSPTDDSMPPIPWMVLRSAWSKVYLPVTDESAGLRSSHGPNVPRAWISPRGTAFSSVAS